MAVHHGRDKGMKRTASKGDYFRALNDYSFASLRAFRESARCESFTLAAEQLSVTPSAISHHIKLLEQNVGIKMFYRRGRRLQLTDEGKRLFDAINRSFESLERAIVDITAGKIRRRVVFGVLSSLTNKWLLPRLGGFYAANPGIELIVRSVNHTIDIEREPIDLAMVMLPMPPQSERARSVMMWQERVFAVCSPGYAERLGDDLRVAADLGYCTLLHDETEISAERGLDWQSWLEYFSMSDALDRASSQYFSQSDFVLQSAIAGHGIALTRMSMAANDIRQGLLVNPFPRLEMSTPTGCYLCALESLWGEEKVAKLRDWLVDEAKKDKYFRRQSGSAD